MKRLGLSCYVLGIKVLSCLHPVTLYASGQSVTFCQPIMFRTDHARPLHRDDRPIPRKGRPLISPIGLNQILLAAGPGFARIPFYTGFTKKGFYGQIQ